MPNGCRRRARGYRSRCQRCASGKDVSHHQLTGAIPRFPETELRRGRCIVPRRPAGLVPAGRFWSMAPPALECRCPIMSLRDARPRQRPKTAASLSSGAKKGGRRSAPPLSPPNPDNHAISERHILGRDSCAARSWPHAQNLLTTERAVPICTIFASTNKSCRTNSAPP